MTGTLMALFDREEVRHMLAKAKQALKDDGFVVDSRRTYADLEGQFRRLLALGIPIAAGTDVGSAAHFRAGAIC